MPEITSTEAARHLSDILDAVEHNHARFTIVRHGHPVALLEPVLGGRGSAAKQVLRRNGADPGFAADVAQARLLLNTQNRP